MPLKSTWTTSLGSLKTPRISELIYKAVLRRSKNQRRKKPRNLPRSQTSHR